MSRILIVIGIVILNVLVLGFIVPSLISLSSWGPIFLSVFLALVVMPIIDWHVINYLAKSGKKNLE